MRLAVLLYLSNYDSYGYDLVKIIGQIFNTPSGTIYPLLYKLTDDNLVETYIVDETEGGIRKYYKLNQKGREVLQKELLEWEEFISTYQQFFKKYRK